MENIIVALIAFAGTAIGSIVSVYATSNLTLYRIKQLEAKVLKHNNLIERMFIVEESTKSAHKRIDEIHAEITD